MALETVTHISDLNPLNPTGSDAKSQGDDHIRNIKTALKTDFPNINGVVSASDEELSRVTGVTSPIQAQIDLKAPKASPAFTGVPTAPTATLGASGDQIATLDFVNATAFVPALPSQTGNAGKVITTNGTTASWANMGLVKLATLTPTAGATALSALTAFTSEFDDYLIVGRGLGMQTDGTVAACLAVAGALDATAKYGMATPGTPASMASTAAGLTATVTAAGVGFGFSLLVSNVNDTAALKTLLLNGSYEGAVANSITAAVSMGAYKGANAVSGVSILASTTFKGQGSVTIYGIQRN